jgi:hypothetical protein
MSRLPALLIGLALALPTFVLAQWQWVDNNGRRVFSDQAPPPDIPLKNILRQPGGARQAQPADAAPVAAVPASGAASAAAPAMAGASAARPSGRDTELERRKKQAEAAEAQKNKAEADRIAQLRAENCTRVRQAKATLDSGRRMTRDNAKGEPEVLDEAARAAEGRRLDGLIASECNPT